MIQLLLAMFIFLLIMLVFLVLALIVMLMPAVASQPETRGCSAENGGRL